MMPSFAELSERLLEFQRKELGPGVSDKEINELESTLKVPVKGGYREFLRQVGYGGVEHLELYGLGGPPFLNLGRVTESERSEIGLRLPLYLLPIMNDGFGNLHCLDTRVVGEPPVVFWDHEAECNQIVEVEAEDFISWMWSLH